MEWRLFPEGTAPECATAAWYADRESAPHLEQPTHRDRLFAVRDQILAARAEHGIGSVVDLGAGDGGLLSILPPDLTAWGYDLCPANVTVATERRHVDVRYLDLVAEEPEWADLAVCTEMLEHLVDPHAFVRRIAGHCRVLVASSPATETDRQHYEHHLFAWDMEGYRDLLRQAGYRVVHHRIVAWFQVVLGVKLATGGLIRSKEVYLVGESGPEQFSHP